MEIDLSDQNIKGSFNINEAAILRLNGVSLDTVSKLYIRRNGITALSSDILRFARLTEISLRDNLITEFPMVLLQLGKSLTKLSLSFNRLASIPSEIGQLKNLQLLSLAGNQLERLPDEIGQLHKLQGLDLQRNLLQALPNTMGCLLRLQTLLLQNNRLSAIPNLERQRDLRVLNIGFNQLLFLPGCLSSLRLLEEFNCSGNQISIVPTGIFPQLKRLCVLEMHTNRIKALPSDLGDIGIRLKRLNVAINQLTELPESIGQLEGLEWLNCNDNQLTTLPKSIGRLRSMVKVGMVQNQLQCLPLEIGMTQRLVKLDLRRNKLRYLPSTIVHCKSLTSLMLDGNPLLPATTNVSQQKSPVIPSLVELASRTVWMTCLAQQSSDCAQIDYDPCSPAASPDEVDNKCASAVEALSLPFPLQHQLSMLSVCFQCLGPICRLSFDCVDFISVPFAHSITQLPINLRFCSVKCQRQYFDGGSERKINPCLAQLGFNTSAETGETSNNVELLEASNSMDALSLSLKQPTKLQSLPTGWLLRQMQDSANAPTAIGNNIGKHLLEGIGGHSLSRDGTLEGF